MTFSERLVGRRKPADPSHFTELMAGFVKPDGTLCGRSNPSDRWMVPAFTKARKEGLIRMGMRMGFGGRPGPRDGIWYLTERGEPVARECRKDFDEKRAEITAWARDVTAALRARKAAPEPDPDEDRPGNGDGPEP